MILRRSGWGLLFFVLCWSTWHGLAKDAPRRQGLQIGSMTFKDQADVIAKGARCATSVLKPELKAVVRRTLRNWKRPANADGINIVIPIQYIHLTNGNQGQITEQQRVDQTQVLNDAYNQHGFEFCYDPVLFPPKVENNTTWYRMLPGSLAETSAKTALHEDPNTVLNFYTASPSMGLLGWATFPFPSVDQNLDGVVCLDESLPGGNAFPYNEGHTATHEVGHWLGLFHTFEGGCNGVGDEVNDTVAHPNPDSGCPGCGPACATGQCSPAENFMNYTNDSCMNTFTLGQATRMSAVVAMYRPQLGTVRNCENRLDGGGGGNGCPLAKLNGMANKWLPFHLSLDDLDTLRRLRDQVLRRSEPGRALAQLYYRNGAAITELLVRDPVLAGETLMFLAQQMPAVEQAVERDGVVHLSVDAHRKAQTLLAKFRAAGSPALVQAIDRAQQLLEGITQQDHAAATVAIAFPQAPVAVLEPQADPRFTKP